METELIILFLSTLVAGIIPIAIPKLQQYSVNSLLVFTSAYLFSITIIHILPEVFHNGPEVTIGIVVLAGFFFQVILDVFSKGIEHGHAHIESEKTSQKYQVFLPLYIALLIHSLLEGGILETDGHHHEHAVNTVFTGLLIHKIPAVLALTGLMISLKFKTQKALILLLIFASASPIGALINEHLGVLLHEQSSNYLVAFVCGNFLHISTVMFFEINPNHSEFKFKKAAISALGALLAILGELM